MENDFKNLQEIKNNIKVSASNSKIGNIKMDQGGDQKNSTKSEAKSETKTEAVGETKQEPQAVQEIVEKAKVTTGFTSGMFKTMMIVVAIIAVIAIIFGMKAAVDPNLATNIQAVGDAKKMVGGSILKEWTTELMNLLPVVFIIFAIILLVMLIYMHIIKPYIINKIDECMYLDEDRNDKYYKYD